jgi:hypothetical protein
MQTVLAVSLCTMRSLASEVIALVTYRSLSSQGVIFKSIQQQPLTNIKVDKLNQSAINSAVTLPNTLFCAHHLPSLTSPHPPFPVTSQRRPVIQPPQGVIHPCPPLPLLPRGGSRTMCIVYVTSSFSQGFSGRRIPPHRLSSLDGGIYPQRPTLEIMGGSALPF